MGAKYASVSISGYNSSPPSDDGSQTAANLITWAGIKTKLPDPIKTALESINTALVAALNTSVRQITTSDACVAGDNFRTVEIAPTATTGCTVTLADAATMTNVYLVYIKNSSVHNQTLARATGGDTIDGTAANITIPPKAGLVLVTTTGADGYLVLSRSGPFLDTDALVVGSSDGTKKVRLEADGLTTGNTRALTVPDANIKLAGHATGLTASRVPYATGATGGVLTDSANLTFDGTDTIAVPAMLTGVRSKVTGTDRVAVSSATTIYTPALTGSAAGATGALVFVNGYRTDDTTKSFVDLVLFISAIAPVVVTGGSVERNTPATRTYTASGNNLQLAMSANTYNVTTSTFEGAS